MPHAAASSILTPVHETIGPSASTPRPRAADRGDELEASPFQHVGLVPAQPFWAGAALAMLAIAGAASAAAVWAFQRRDLIGP